MARGKQKLAAQEKKAKRTQAKNKGGSQFEARDAGNQKICKICYAQMHSMHNMQAHYEAKHAGRPFVESEYA